MFKINEVKKNKLPALVTILVLLVSLLPLAASAGTTAIPAAHKSAVFTIGSKTVQVDGKPYTMDVAPYIDSGGQAWVPVGYVVDVAGMTAGWNPKDQQVSISDGFGSWPLTVGSNEIVWSSPAVSGGVIIGSMTRMISLDAAPVIIPPGRMMLSVSGVNHIWNGQIDAHWDTATRTVTVTNGSPNPND